MLAPLAQIPTRYRETVLDYGAATRPDLASRLARVPEVWARDWQLLPTRGWLVATSANRHIDAAIRNSYYLVSFPAGKGAPATCTCPDAMKAPGADRAANKAGWCKHRLSLYCAVRAVALWSAAQATDPDPDPDPPSAPAAAGATPPANTEETPREHFEAARAAETASDGPQPAWKHPGDVGIRHRDDNDRPHCQFCDGWGQVRASRNNSDGRVNCPECGGTGYDALLAATEAAEAADDAADDYTRSQRDRADDLLAEYAAIERDAERTEIATNAAAAKEAAINAHEAQAAAAAAAYAELFPS